MSGHNDDVWAAKLFDKVEPITMITTQLPDSWHQKPITNLLWVSAGTLHALSSGLSKCK